jgi:hypothetical protein
MKEKEENLMEHINQSHFGKLSELKKITKDDILVLREIKLFKVITS